MIGMVPVVKQATAGTEIAEPELIGQLGQVPPWRKA